MKRKSRRRRSIVALAAALVVLLLLLDQVGVRRLSGADFPSRDPGAPAIRAAVEKLADPAWNGRAPGTPGNEAAAAWLAGELEKAGLSPLPSLGGSWLSRIRDGGANVIGWLPASGGGDAQKTLVIGAHFDHLGKSHDGLLLGADDNASSVAAVLASLPAIAARTDRRRPLAVIFFDDEEPPAFNTPAQGSEQLLASPPRELDPAGIQVAVILDLLGGVVWRPAADTIFACGAETGRGLGPIVDGVREEGLDVRRAGMHLIEHLPGYPLMPVSDYLAFRARRVPFLFLSSGRTPRYHTAGDLPETLHYDRLARSARWIARLTAALDASAAPIPWDEGGADLERDRDTMLWAFESAASPWRSIPGTGPVTMGKLVADRSRLRAMASPDHAFTAEDVAALERASFRLQCLLYGYPACFTF